MRAYIHGSDLNDVVNQSNVVIGEAAASGSAPQGAYGIAIGSHAGHMNQGEAAVAIGKEAGTLNQPARSIILNASNAPLNASVTDACFVAPIRNVALPQGLCYDPSTSEIGYAPFPSSSMISGYVQNLDSANTCYFGIDVASFNGLTPSTTESSASTAIPFDCTLSHFYVYLSGNPGVGASGYTFTVRKNGVNTLVANFMTGSTTFSSDVTDTVSFTAGDVFTIGSVPNVSPFGGVSARWSCRLTAN